MPGLSTLGYLGDTIEGVQRSCEMFLSYLQSAPARRAACELDET